MSETWQQQPPVAPSRDRRPRRSRADRKIAGVAGGVGRSLGIDPIVLRIAFVVLTVFGGFGGLLYVLGWLFLPDDGDEVSAAEALVGRGRSSVSPVLAVGLAIVAVIATLSMFSWGLPFFPIVVIAVIVGFVMNKKRSQPAGSWQQQEWQQREWQQRAQTWGVQAGDQAQKLSGKVEGWGKQAEDWVNRQPWAGGNSGCGAKARKNSVTSEVPTAPPAPSPFGAPPFWDAPAPTTPPVSTSNDPTPPAWDPLGVAPFAWDLPEPGPASAPAPVASQGPKERPVAARVTLAFALLGGALVAAGNFAGWWDMPWAFATGVALAVIGLGLVLTSFVGRGRSLIGHGVFFALATLALGFTGISGTSGYGHEVWRPTSVTQLQDTPYVVNAGYGELDLSGLVIPAGTTERVSFEVRAGHGELTVPAGTTVEATCSVQAGGMTCLGTESDGVRQTISQTLEGAENRGTLIVELDVRAGNGEVLVP